MTTLLEAIAGGQVHREEMNLIEHPVGIVSDRVPINPVTGQEYTEIRFEQEITEAGKVVAKRWVVSGEVTRGGLPRGFDLDVLTAIIAEWGRGNFAGHLISLQSVYSILKTAGRNTNKQEYERFEEAMNRLYGVSFDTQHAVYDPTQGRRVARMNFRLFQAWRLEREERGNRVFLRGYIRATEEFRALVKRGYVKLTDTARYWRLPTTYTRQLFQYLDKHRYRAVRDNGGRFQINGYLLLRKIGTLQETVAKYRPAKVRSLLDPHLEALVKDGYLASFSWKRGRKAHIELSIVFAQDARGEPADDREERTARYIAAELGEEKAALLLHRSYVRRVGVDVALELLQVALEQTRVSGNAAAYYVSLVKNIGLGEQEGLFPVT
jgi:hypothetical protein